MARRKKGLIINGIINLDKPLGLSSNQALQKVKYLFNAQKAGHTGSLDPLASGVLPLCFGHATKVSSLLLNSDKRYHAGIYLGSRTTTGDKEGEHIGPVSKTLIEQQKIIHVLKDFTGGQQQLPPMYSALKINGQPLYKLARQGIDVKRDSRDITIHSIQLLEYQFPELVIDVSCSKGTYIRSLAEDIGNALGCGAHLFSLRRVQAGDFLLSDSYSLEQLAQLKQQNELNSVLCDADSVLQHLPEITLTEQQSEDIRLGRKVIINYKYLSKQLENSEQQIRLYENNTFLGLAQLEIKKLDQQQAYYLQPKRLFC
ncbi:MAG: tRNA pseudouridine(55) synthase TruB [Pseudomonadota bacterium]